MKRSIIKHSVLIGASAILTTLIAMLKEAPENVRDSIMLGSIFVTIYLIFVFIVLEGVGK